MFPRTATQRRVIVRGQRRSGEMWKWIRDFILLRWLMKLFGRHDRTRRAER